MLWAVVSRNQARPDYVMVKRTTTVPDGCKSVGLLERGRHQLSRIGLRDADAHGPLVVGRYQSAVVMVF